MLRGMRLVLAVLVAVVALAAATAAAGAPHLLIDNHEIQSVKGLARVIEKPVVRPAPIIDGANDQNYTPYLSVLTGGNGLRLWFDARNPETGERYLGYRESADGFTWKDARAIRTPEEMRYGVSVIKDGAGFVLAWYGWRGVHIARSPDGITWTQIAGPILGETVGDIISLVKTRGQYFLYYKTYEGPRRVVGVTTSTDLLNWSPGNLIFQPDTQDEGATEFYSLGGITERGGLMVGFLRVLRDDIDQGVGYTVLAWSRDGLTWQRDRQPFLDRKPGTFYGAMAWADAQATMGNQTLIYFGGYSIGHKPDPYTSRTIGVATISTDRYVARAGTGSLTTKPLTLGKRTTVNSTGVTVQVLRAGKPTRSCAVKAGVAVVVPCATAGEARLRFVLRNSRLYAFGT